MDEIAWFRTADSCLGIFGWNDLADDANLVEPTRGSFGGITLATNVETAGMVDAALDEAAAGGSILKPGTELPSATTSTSPTRTVIPGRSATTPVFRSAPTAGSRSTDRG